MKPNHSLAPVSKYFRGYIRAHKLRQAGYRQLPTPAISRGSNGNTPVLIFPSQSAAERYVRHFRIAGKGERMWDHMGWYTDREFQDETYKPCIAFMGKTGLYGYVETCSGNVVFYLDGGTFIYETEAGFEEAQRGLARRADSVAQKMAEKECDYQERWRKGQEISEEIEEKESARRILFEEARGWIDDFRGTVASPALYARFSRKLAEMRQQAGALLREISTLKEKLKQYPEYE